MLLDHIVELLHRRGGFPVVLDLIELAVEGFLDVGLQRHHVADVVGKRLLVLLLDVAIALVCHLRRFPPHVDQCVDQFIRSFMAHELCHLPLVCL